MTDQFVKSLKNIIKNDSRCLLILMGIGRYLFRELREEYTPQRMVDIGVMEPMAVGMAAGLSVSGMIPFLYTWSPFLIERAYEQLKLDFGVQNLNGNFFGAGASYDLTNFGDSHYCPADIPILKQIKNMQIIVPGTAKELSLLLKETYDNNSPTYFRLSIQENAEDHNVLFGKAVVIKKGKKATIVAVGPMLNKVLSVAMSYDVTILYYTTVKPFDADTFLENLSGDRILLCEPYNKGALLIDIIQALENYKVKIDLVGFETESECTLGTYDQNELSFGVNESTIKTKLERLLRG